MKEIVQQEINQSRLITALLGLRIQKGMSQKEVADAMGCTASKISKIEGGSDTNLKWGDITGYLSALGISMSVLFDDSSLPAAHRIKHMVLEIHKLLEGLAGLAQEVSDDEEIVSKIHQFYGEVLFNFLVRFEKNHSQLQNVAGLSDFTLEIPAGKAPAEECPECEAVHA